MAFIKGKSIRRRIHICELTGLVLPTAKVSVADLKDCLDIRQYFKRNSTKWTAYMEYWCFWLGVSVVLDNDF